MTDHEKDEKAALAAVKLFVAKGEWPAPGTLATCIDLKKRIYA